MAEWISVNDRLPETRHAVLAYSPHHNNIWALSLHEDGNWYFWTDVGRRYYDPDWMGPITHWTQMPEPPKEDAADAKITEYTGVTPPRKHACINCGHRYLCGAGAGSRCGYDGHYIGYCNTWDEWCRHWKKDKRKPGEIEVYGEAD